MSQTLLIADDSLTIQRVIKLAFANEHLDVVAVSSGEQAIEQIEAHPPAIVLADTRMPDRNGYEIAEFIKGKQAYNEIPVVLMSGAFEPVDDRRAREAGCEAVLVKPFEPEKLVSTVKELLGARAEPAGEASLAAPSRPTPPSATPSKRKPRSGAPLGEPELTWPVADELPVMPREAVTEPAAAVLESPAAVAEPPEPPVVSAEPSAPAAPPASVGQLPEVRADTPKEGAPAPLVITDELVDRLATRVIARLSDRVVRETTTDVVTQVAERLVSEEIKRLKDTLRES